MKRGMGKDGQFFLLAAVVISAIVLSLGATSNQAKVNKEPKDFYEGAEDVRREIGEFIDYQIYTSPSENISNLVDTVALDVRDDYGDVEFVVLYGNSNNVTLENHGSSHVNYSCDGANSFLRAREYVVTGQVCNPSCVNITALENATRGFEEHIYWCSGVNISAVLAEQQHQHDFGPTGTQVVFLIQKDIGEESYVSS